VLPPSRGFGGTPDDGRQAAAIIRHRNAQLRPAQVDADLALHLHALGAFGYIRKPFEVAEIGEAVSAAIAHRRAPVH